jgi:hypothetical protein
MRPGRRKSGLGAKQPDASRSHAGAGFVAWTLVSLLVVYMLAHAIAAHAFEVYHSPSDDGTPAEDSPVVVIGANPTVLHLYLRGAPTPQSSPTGSACIGREEATGTEICGWDLQIGASDGLQITGLAPEPGVVHHLADASELRINGGRVRQPATTPEKIGDLTVLATGPGTLEVRGVHFVDARMRLQAVPSLPLASAVAQDGDGDGVADDADNCTLVANADQRDTDNDGFGNACDADLNNDGAVNFVDLGLMKSVFFTNNANADLNGDGAVNFVDLGLLRARFFAAPGPSGVAP